VARLVARVALLLALVGAPAAAAPVDPLQSLHVRTFSLSADKDAIRVGESVNVTITLRVDEPVDSIDNVILPELFGFQNLSDERHLQSSGAGTTYVETLTLQATEAGDHRIGPATLEAIDARTKRPTRFGSNTIVVRVAAAPPSIDGSWVRKGLALLGGLVGLTLALILFTRLARPSVGTAVRIELEPQVAPAPSVPVPSESERWRALTEALAEHPTRENVIAVRALLRQHVGARADETFGDVLAREAGRLPPELLEAMRAVERAAFIDDVHLRVAVRDAAAALGRFAATVQP
jgi:hypothetical protein